MVSGWGAESGWVVVTVVVVVVDGWMVRNVCGKGPLQPRDLTATVPWESLCGGTRVGVSWKSRQCLGVCVVNEGCG